MRFHHLLGACAMLVACQRAGEPPARPPREPAPAAPTAASKPEADESPPEGRLPADTRPEAYRLELEIVPARPTYRGVVSIDVTLDQPRSRIWLHGRGQRIEKAEVEPAGAPPIGARVEPAGGSGLIAVQLPESVGPGRVRLTLRFEADLGARLTGIYRSEVEGVPYVFSQFEPISAREAFPCFDEPRFKTPFELTLRVPEGQAAIANTRVREERSLGGGMRELRFEPTEKLPTYLIALAVGPLDIVNGKVLAATPPLRTHAVPLRGVAVRGRGQDLAHALAQTPPLVGFLERYFGTGYPYDKLDLIAVPDFAAGAMENAGAITYRETLLLVKPDASEQQTRSLAYVNAHELAHQWFGNLVTMPWWDDIWLNEAFATWMGTRALAGVMPQYEAELGALSATHGAMELDGRSAARKIRQPIESDHDIQNAFDQITYSKGGAVLSMFERYLGAETFQRGLQTYMSRYRFGSADARDLVRTLGEVSNQSELTSSFFTFLEQPGVPLVEVQLDCTAGQPVVELSQQRDLPLGSQAARDLRWQVPVCLRYGSGASAHEACTLLREDKARIPLDVEDCPAWLMPNAGAQGYYRFSLPDRVLDNLVEHRNKLSTLEQMSLASNVGASLVAGRIGPARALASQQILMRNAHRHVIETALRTYALAAELLAPESLPALRLQVRNLLRPAYRKLGLVPKPGQASTGEQKLMRASLARALFALGEDPEVTRALAKLGLSVLDGTAGASAPEVPSELLELAFTAAVREGGATAFDKAEQKLFASSDGALRARLLTALAYVRDPALGERVLGLGLDPRLRTNERLIPLLGQSGQRETHARAFEWLRTHLDALLTALGSSHASDLIDAQESFCDEADARAVEAFFTPHIARIAGGPRVLALTLESIRMCAAVKQTHQETLSALYAPPTTATPAAPSDPSTVE